MRKLVVMPVLLLSLTMWGCVAKEKVLVRVPDYPPVPGELARVVKVVSGSQWGMGTPVSPTRLLTAAHVLGTNLEASADGRRVKLVWRDSVRDLALLEVIEGPRFYSWVIVSKEAPQSGDVLYSMAFVGAKLTWSIVVCRFMAEDEDGDYLLDGFAVWGMSGGGVFNQKGELVGVHKAIIQPYAAVGQIVNVRSLGVVTPVVGRRVE